MFLVGNLEVEDVTGDVIVDLYISFATMFNQYKNNDPLRFKIPIAFMGAPDNSEKALEYFKLEDGSKEALSDFFTQAIVAGISFCINELVLLVLCCKHKLHEDVARVLKPILEKIETTKKSHLYVCELKLYQKDGKVFSKCEINKE